METNKLMHVIKKGKSRPPTKSSNFVEPEAATHSESDVEAGYARSNDQINQRRIAKLDQKLVGKSRSEILAQDFECVHHKHLKDLKELFPSEPWRWHVDWYYPNAVGGPLYIDEPTTIEELSTLERKRAFLINRKIRYVILSPLKTISDDLMELEHVDHIAKRN